MPRSEITRSLVITLLLILTACQTLQPVSPQEMIIPEQIHTPKPSEARTGITATPVVVNLPAVESAASENSLAETLPAAAGMPTSETPLAESALTSMPSGPAVAYVRDGSIWVDMGEQGAWAVSSGSSDTAPMFSPDGRWVLFRRALPMTVDEGLPWELWLASIDGTVEVPVAGPTNLSGPNNQSGSDLPSRLPVNPVWSPDSRLIAFETQPQCGLCDSSHDLWIYNLETGQVSSLLVDEQGGGMAFSPDSQRIAVSSRTDISVMDADGQNRQVLLVYEPIIYLNGFHYPALAWSPDGTSILTVVPPKELMQFLMGQATEGLESRTSLWRLWLNGDSDLIAQAPRVSGGAWSPDRSLFAYSEIGTARLVVLSTSSGGMVHEGVGLFQNWNPDNRRYTFLPDMPGKTFWLGDLEMGSIDGSAWRLVPEDEAGGARPVIWVDDNHFIYLAKLGESFDGDAFEIRLKEIGGDYRVIYTAPERWLPMDVAVYAP